MQCSDIGVNHEEVCMGQRAIQAAALDRQTKTADAIHSKRLTVLNSVGGTSLLALLVLFEWVCPCLELKLLGSEQYHGRQQLLNLLHLFGDLSSGHRPLTQESGLNDQRLLPHQWLNCQDPSVRTASVSGREIPCFFIHSGLGVAHKDRQVSQANNEESSMS